MSRNGLPFAIYLNILYKSFTNKRFYHSYLPNQTFPPQMTTTSLPTTRCAVIASLAKTWLRRTMAVTLPLIAGLALATSNAQASLRVVYGGFEYSSAAIGDTPASGTGLTGNSTSGGASPDTLTLWNVAEPFTGSGSAYAAITTYLDQNPFDTFTNGSQQVAILDDIGFGTTLNSIGVVPEPSAYALLAGFLGLIWVMLRRRS